MNLKEARDKGKLKEFAKEQTKKKGDSDKLNATLSSMVGQKKKPAQETSPKADSES